MKLSVICTQLAQALQLLNQMAAKFQIKTTVRRFP
jgi:hypothetical protein